MNHSSKAGEFSSKSPGKRMNNKKQRLELCCSQFRHQQEPISKKPFAEKTGATRSWCIPKAAAEWLRRDLGLTPESQLLGALNFQPGRFLDPADGAVWEQTGEKSVVLGWSPKWDQGYAFGQQSVATLGCKSWWWLLRCSRFLATEIRNTAGWQRADVRTAT